MVWADNSYDWVLFGPASIIDGSGVRVLGLPILLEPDDSAAVAAAASGGESVAVLGYADSDHVRVVTTNATYIPGLTDVVAVGQVISVDSSASQVTLANGIVLDLSQVDADSRPNLMVSDWVVTRGKFYQ